MHLHDFLFGGVLLASSASALSSVYNLTSTGCHDVSSYNTCTTKAAIAAQECDDNATANDSELELLACGCSYYIEMMNCYYASCWNRVYECEYQTYAIQYLSDCPDGGNTLPFFPPPDNAPDACSCNLASLWIAINGSITETSNCSNNVSAAILGDLGSGGTDTDSTDEAIGCICCGESAAYSSYYNICPDTDPSLLGIDEITEFFSTYDEPFSDCTPYLDEFSCISDLGFTDVPDGTFYTPGNLPANGTNTLSNVAGTVTAPPSGTVFSYTNTYDSQEYTITAVVNGDVAGVTTGSAASGTATGTGSSTGTSTATGSAASASKSSGSAAGFVAVDWRIAAAVGVAGAAVAM